MISWMHGHKHASKLEPQVTAFFQVGIVAILLFQTSEYTMMVVIIDQDERVCVCRHCHWTHGGEEGKCRH